MRKFLELIRLKYGPVPPGSAPLSHRVIAAALSMAHTTVNRYIAHIEAAGLNQWPLPEGMAEADLEAMLVPKTAPRRERPLPEWSEVHRIVTTEKGATIVTQWEAYQAQHGAEAYSLTQYKTYYRRWAKQHTAVMRFEHTPGEHVYVDFAGRTMEIVHRESGEVSEVQIFVACLGYSQYIYAEAVMSQKLADWIGAHVRMFAYYGGVPRTVVCDNLKSAVTKPHRYEPDLNPTYWELAQHYQVVILPARASKPRDKALVENAVKLITQRLLHPLSSRTFHSLGELNTAIADKLTALNAQPFQKMAGSRIARFATVERATLRPLPKLAYEYAEWKTVKVGPSYHVCPSRKEGRLYSVPFELIGQTLEVRVGDRTVTVYHQVHGVDGIVAVHERKRYPGFSTIPAHRSDAHAAACEWTPERLHGWASRVGPHVAELVVAIFTKKYAYPEQGIPSVMGLLSLAKIYGKDRLNLACERALAHEIYSSRSVRSILDTGLDKHPMPAAASTGANTGANTGENTGEPSTTETDQQRSVLEQLSKGHQNARGAEYYARSVTRTRTGHA